MYQQAASCSFPTIRVQEHRLRSHLYCLHRELKRTGFGTSHQIHFVYVFMLSIVSLFASFGGILNQILKREGVVM